VDAELAGILAFMLRGDTRSAIAMYGTLTSSQAKIRALQAAARAALTRDDLRLFRAILALVRRAAEKRNKIAHWLWGVCYALPDALILIDPDAVLDHVNNRKEFIIKVATGDFTSPMPEIDTSKAFVYRSEDFAEIITEFVNVWHFTLRFASILGDPDRVVRHPDDGNAIADALREQLSNEPQIREILNREKPGPA
jgi:hypothetical protein